MSNEEEEVYQEVRRDLLRRYYYGDLTRSEYESELEELKTRRYGGMDGGGGLGLNFDSYWKSLPPEQFDRNLSIFTFGVSLFCFYLGYYIHVSRESPLFSHYGATSNNVAILLVVSFGLMCFLIGSWGLREWWRRKRSGEYASGGKTFCIKRKEEV